MIWTCANEKMIVTESNNECICRYWQLF